MNTKYEIDQVRKLLAAADRKLNELQASLDKPAPGKLPRPYVGQVVAFRIFEALPNLKGKVFSVRDVMNQAEAIEKQTKIWRSQSAYSNVLSQWEREGYLQIVEAGSGRRPTRYRVLPESV